MDELQIQIDEHERYLEGLQSDLIAAKEVVQSWVQAGSDLSINAAAARAKNQGAGKGLAGAIFGAKFRSVMRAGASASNAAIAKDVAQKRAVIAENKAAAQAQVKEIQAAISIAKSALKDLKSRLRIIRKDLSPKKTRPADSVDLLHKLKEAYDIGLLTQDEYENKRRKIVDSI